ncbi:MAG TPA: hypothetical protein VJB11_00605 [archaeon]|nr:hypothetical protein [archaeon]
MGKFHYRPNPSPVMYKKWCAICEMPGEHDTWQHPKECTRCGNPNHTRWEHDHMMDCKKYGSTPGVCDFCRSRDHTTKNHKTCAICKSHGHNAYEHRD